MYQEQCCDFFSCVTCGNGKRMKRFFPFFLLIFLFGCASTVKHDLAVEYYNLGNAYYKIKEYEKAIEFFNKSIAQDPSLLHAHYNLSVALIQKGRGAEANRILRTLLEKEPENTAILGILGYSLYVQKKGEEALEIFARILSLNPHDPNALYNRGVVLWDLGRKGEAEETFKDLLSSHSEKGDEIREDTLFNLGKLLAELERFKEAIEYLEEYLEWRNKDVDALSLLSKAYRSVERYNKALEILDTRLTVDENVAAIWMDRAEILLARVEDPVMGMEALSQALSLGFKDKKRIKLLLDDPGLIQREQIEEILRYYELMP